jgi:hypothetical protein
LLKMQSVLLLHFPLFLLPSALHAIACVDFIPIPHYHVGVCLSVIALGRHLQSSYSHHDRKVRKALSLKASFVHSQVLAAGSSISWYLVACVSFLVAFSLG